MATIKRIDIVFDAECTEAEAVAVAQRNEKLSYKNGHIVLSIDERGLEYHRLVEEVRKAKDVIYESCKLVSETKQG